MARRKKVDDQGTRLAERLQDSGVQLLITDKEHTEGRRIRLIQRSDAHRMIAEHQTAPRLLGLIVQKELVHRQAAAVQQFKKVFSGQCTDPYNGYIHGHGSVSLVKRKQPGRE